MGAHTVSVVLDSLGRASGCDVPVVRYRVTSGPDKRLSVDLSSERIIIGTSAAAQVVLTDDTVSALHCELRFDRHGLRVRDLGAKNGVYLQGVRVFDALVTPGSTLTVGRSTLKVTLPGGSVVTPLEPHGLEGLVGTSLAMRMLHGQVKRVAASSANVLISGPIGSGKDLVADAVVANSDRRERPVVVVDCRSIPEGLAESEFFGHEAGAFTGATRQRAGVFERSHTGTLILDEVGELSVASQARLLGVLQRGTLRRVGGQDEVRVDVRVISTTAHDVGRLVNQQRFRADLSYRLAGVELRVPSLEERREDVPLLVAHFLDLRRPRPVLSPAVLEQLFAHDYSGGNVRELANAVERAVAGVQPSEPVIAPGAAPTLEVPYATQRQRLLEGFERAYVAKLLEACEGNVSAAARRGGLNRVHLHELINRLGLKGHV